jgi:hypothetical protein
MPPPPAPPADPVPADISPHLGTYRRAGTDLDVLAGSGGPMLRVTATGPLAELMPDPVQEFVLVPAGGDRYLVRAPGEQTWTTVTFYALPTGERYVHFGGRATPKVG